MAIAAYLDDESVEMRIVTEFGERITIVYDRDSIFAVMRHIQQIARDCPEILHGGGRSPPGRARGSIWLRKRPCQEANAMCLLLINPKCPESF